MSEQKDAPKSGEETAGVGKSKRGRRRKGMCLDDRPLLEPNAAGIDIGAQEIFLAVPPDRDENPVRVFSTFTEDLEAMARWLVSCGITTVAMESTGSVLDSALRSAGTTRGEAMFGGRPWHEKRTGAAHGLARMPVDTISAFGRTAARGISTGRRCMRGAVVDAAPRRSGGDGHQHIQHLHKALTQMNVQIHHVISDITGLTALAIVDAIIGGQRDPLELAKLRNPHIKASEETICKSLKGNWRSEHLFTLKQSRQMYQHYEEQIAACDEEIEKLLVAFQPWVDPDEKPLPPDRKRKQRGRKKKNVNPKTGFDLRTESHKLFAVDLTQVPG